MNAKEYLQQVSDQACQVQIQKNRIEMLKAIALRVTPAYGAEPIAKSRDVTLHEMQALEIIDAEEQLERMVTRLVCVRKEVTEVLKLMHNERHREILYARYINGLSWESIGRMINRTKRAACYKHLDALDEMEKIMQGEAFRKIHAKYAEYLAASV